MDSKVLKWILIIAVVGIWANAIRVSLPVFMEYFTQRGNGKLGEVSGNERVNLPEQKKIDVTTVRNPFVRTPKHHAPPSKTERSAKAPEDSREKAFSIFNFRGTFSVNGKKVAILEGRSDLGVSGIFYAEEGETIMDEKIVEIGENYVIIFKGGQKIMLHEAR